MSEAVFCIIKPDALNRRFMGRIFSRIEDTSLSICRISSRWKSPEWARAHYEHCNGEDFFDNLIDFMTQRSIVGFVVYGKHARGRLRTLVGSTKSWEAAPGTIRGDWGSYPAWKNLIHVSDSHETLMRESELFYDPKTDWR